MKLRLLVKLGVALSVILFCIGIGFYGFARLSVADKNQGADLLEYVSADCYGLFEIDNIDFFLHGFSDMAYAAQLDTLHRTGLVADVLNDLNNYSSSAAHGLSNRMNHLLVSFHTPGKPDVVAYFHAGKEEKRQLVEAVRRKYNVNFVSKEETYRGEKIEVFPMDPAHYLSVYEEGGVLAVSYQKNLIERVIDAKKDGASLRNDAVFSSIHQPKSVNHLTIYGRTASLPFFVDGHPCWSEFDVNMNSEVFYLSGAMYMPDSCMQTIEERLDKVQPVVEKDSLLIVSGPEKVDSCISSVIASPFHSLFDECTANLSRDASYIMVADMDKIAKHPEQYASFLPGFLLRHPDLFRSFILSVQIKKVKNHFSHIFVFTYKD